MAVSASRTGTSCCSKISGPARRSAVVCIGGRPGHARLRRVPSVAAWVRTSRAGFRSAASSRSVAPGRNWPRTERPGEPGRPGWRPPRRSPRLDPLGVTPPASGGRRILESATDALLHFDTRSDNLRLQSGGRLRLFDWPYASLGPPELDVAAFAQSITCEGGPDRTWRSTPTRATCRRATGHGLRHRRRGRLLAPCGPGRRPSPASAGPLDPAPSAQSQPGLVRPPPRSAARPFGSAQYLP